MAEESESSPPPSSSAESNFRELDDAFLQTQTRIWLGEVLQIRFDEQMNISDLLADGELLFEVSEVISRMLPKPAADASLSKVNEWKSVASSKSTRRYMPYFNVGSFLRMCKSMGLDGIDLFTPSDVVEKRNTRKVCMCIRSLSKKARSRDLNVPDFESVTCTLTMPTDMVECIRKSLELSQCSSSLSVEQDSEKASRIRYWQRSSTSASAVSNGYSSDNCDDAESGFMVAESSEFACDAESPNIPDSQVGGDCSPVLKLQLNMGDVENEENEQCEYLSPSISESVGSPCSQYYTDQEEVSTPSSTCLASRISGKALEVNGDDEQNHAVSHVPIDWGESSLDVGNAKNDEPDHIPQDKEDTNSTCYDACSPTREKNMYNVYIENLTHPSENDYEERSCGNTDDLNADETRRISKLESLEDEHMDTNAAKHEMFVCGVSSDVGKSYSDKKVENGDLLSQKAYVSGTTKVPNCSCDDGISQICTEDISKVNCTKNEKGAFDANLVTSAHAEGHFDDDFKGMVVAEDSVKCLKNHGVDREILVENINGKAFYTEDARSVNSFTQQEAESVEVSDQKHNQSAENIEKGELEHIKEEGTNQDRPVSKPQRKLFKSVVKGTAVLGVAMFLLHLRKTSRENLSKAKNQPIEVLVTNTPKPSSQKGQKGGTSSSIYPAEKLNLGV